MADDIMPRRPDSEDIREDDLEFDPQLEPKSAKAWINLLNESEEVFQLYNDHCDKIEKAYANLGRLGDLVRDKEFQMFWANVEVIKPSIYAKPPQPVVVPKFKDRRPVYQQASEIMERCCKVAFDLAGIDELMKLIRDDLALLDRGVAWVRYEDSKGNGHYNDHERVCIDFKNRRDFLHTVARNWREVTWVAAASYLTRSEARRRFRKYSGDEYQDAEYRVDKESVEVGGADYRERAKFWEIWDKANRRVLWVAEGCERILDEDDPHLDLREFFPCPKPAYGTVQRGSLVPVPDVMQYNDQLEEINMLTGRIHALSDALEAKGFYPAGGAELSDAIQTAVATKTAGRILVPIANWAAFGGSSEVIIWLPIDKIADTITTCVTLRKQVIDDIYQIIGLSDIMRGATDPQETLGAQELKTEYGSVRIRDKQQELVRLARDLVEICSEIITEKFDTVTIIEMSQTQIPTQQMQKKQVADIQQQLAQQQRMAELLMQSPQVQQGAQQNPQMMQQAQQGLQGLQKSANDAIGKIMNKPTIEQVMKLFRDNRAKSFILDIETDSTINADERAEKQARTEFVQVLSTLLPQLAMMIGQQPGTADFCGELLKFATAPFRAGRTLDGAIDDLVEQMKQQSGQQKPDDPITAKTKADMQIAQMKIQAEKAAQDADRQVKIMEIQSKAQTDSAMAQMEGQSKQAEIQGRAREQAAKLQQIQMETDLDAQHHQFEMAQAATKAQAEMAKHAATMQMAQQKQQHTEQAFRQKSQHADQAFQQHSAQSEQDANARREQQQFRMAQPRPGGGR